MIDENTSAEGTENSAETTETSTTETSAESGSSTTETKPLSLAGDDETSTTEGDDTAEGDKGDDEDTRTDEEKAADEARAALFGAPPEGENYQIEGLPEGTVLDEEALKAVEPALRELGLSNAGASKLVTTYAEAVLPRVTEQVSGLIQEEVLATRKGWEVEARQAIAGKDADGNPVVLKSGTGVDLSFDGLSEDKVMKTAAKALDRIAPAGFRDFLKETGLDRHPSMVAFAYQAGKTLAEDTDSGGGSGSGGRPQSRVDKYYPS